ncbi:MAG: DUF481 domain-containing protein [Bacteroidales bacterium]
MKTRFILAILALSATRLIAQDPVPEADSLRKDALNVYMETSDYVRRAIPYINYVRDIKDASVYIISNTQQTGAGGREYTYFLVGQHEFTGMNDTLSFSTAPDETMDGRRQKEIATLKMGLMRYVAKTPLSQYIDINFTQPMSETVTTDKWKSWVFEPSVSAFMMGQAAYKRRFAFGEFSANRVTEDWKINLGLEYNYTTENYHVDDDIITSNTTSKSVNALVVRSINDHWSYGGILSAGTSTFNNFDLSLELMPGIEYDVFPYSESTRRQLRFLYSAGYSYSDYTDTTIYDMTKEHLWQQSLMVAYEVVQKWGNIDVNAGYSNYLHDWSKNNLNFGGFIRLRVAKGLSIRLSGDYSIIHDQLGLVKGGVSAEDVLLQIKELETQYSFNVSFGFSYTFGSIYNNVVNPRFSRRRGGMMIMF